MKHQSVVPKMIFSFLGLISLSLLFGNWETQYGYAATCMRGTLLDTDCDGLADSWENLGYYDPNNDGKRIYLPGAKFNHKNLFIEIDYMPPHTPRADALDDVKRAFQFAPVSNGDGIGGVTVYIIPDSSTPIAHTTCTNFWTTPEPAFNTIKRTHIGTSLERSADPTNVYSEKKDVFLYGIFIHTQCGNTGSSGTSEIIGNDFAVSLGASGWARDTSGHNVGSRDQQAGTLMHEIGHNLALQHGGNVPENCKPNYLSVMSWSRQFNNFVSNRPLDFSRSVIMPYLNESKLDERIGIGLSSPAGQTTVIGRINQPSIPETRLVPTGSIAINYDWWGDSDATESSVQSSINNMGFVGCNSNTLSPLFGFNDWIGMSFWNPSGGGILDIRPPINDTSALQASEANATRVNQTTGDRLDDDIPNNVSAASFGNISNPTTADFGNLDRDLSHPDVTIDDIRTSRQSLVNEIKQLIAGVPGGERGVPNQHYSNPADADRLRGALIAQLNVIDRFSQLDRLPEAVDNMQNFRSKMDSAFGESNADDVIVNEQSQRILVPLIDNFVTAIQSQQ